MTAPCTELDSPVGRLLLAASADGITCLLFADDDGVPLVAKHRPRSDGSATATEFIAAMRAQLAEYFDGRRRTFDVPLAPSGTPFQRDVWAALEGVCYGHTSSYGDLARAIGRPRAVRAVGAANRANPLCIVVPCHRIVGHHGRLTGYAGGLAAKRHLLRLEGIEVRGESILRSA